MSKNVESKTLPTFIRARLEIVPYPPTGNKQASHTMQNDCEIK